MRAYADGPYVGRTGPLTHPYSLLKPFFQDVDNQPMPLSLLPTALDNQHVITPLAILSSCQEGQDPDRRLQVLVQWKSLHVDDTSREDWTTLKDTYHLEDKVIFDEAGSDRPSGSQAAQTKRPKRRITATRRFQDYV